MSRNSYSVVDCFRVDGINKRDFNKLFHDLEKKRRLEWHDALNSFVGEKADLKHVCAKLDEQKLNYVVQDSPYLLILVQCVSIDRQEDLRLELSRLGLQIRGWQNIWIELQNAFQIERDQLELLDRLMASLNYVKS